MCQLLALNSSSPATFRFCFRGFCRRGGDTDVHKDGWGLAMYEGRHGLRTFRDLQACARSPVAKFVQDYPCQTTNMMAHIRCATHGRVGLENVHPFTRELWGLPWCFAHNGDDPGFAHQGYGHHARLGKDHGSKPLVYHAIGDTDSEMVFCAILDALRAEYDELPTLPVLFDTLSRLMEELTGPEDICNWLLSYDSSTLFAYSWPGRRGNSKVWNGLYYIIREHPCSHDAHLVDLDYSIDLTTTEDCSGGNLAIVATKPLTDEENWVEMKPGQLVLFNRGMPYSNRSDLEELEQQGQGLSSRCYRKAVLEQV